MGTYTKIKTITLSVLNNAEYLAYMNSVLALLPPPSEEDIPEDLSSDDEEQEAGSPDIGLSGEFVSTMKSEVLTLADAVDESRIAQETEEAVLHDKNRDSLASYITTRISHAGTLPLEAERNAGKYLYKVIKPYIGIARLPVAQETVKIQGLLIDLRKEENLPYVETLGLTSYMDELEKENDAYVSLTSQRTQNRSANKKETSAVLRERIDGYYDDLVLLAQSYSVVSPSEVTATFVGNLNQLTSETIAAYHRRKKGTDPDPDEGGGEDDPERPGEL